MGSFKATSLEEVGDYAREHGIDATQRLLAPGTLTAERRALVVAWFEARDRAQADAHAADERDLMRRSTAAAEASASAARDSAKAARDSANAAQSSSRWSMGAFLVAFLTLIFGIVEYLAPHAR